MLFQVSSNQNLTPSADKSIYHLILTAQTPCPYEAGDWLAVRCYNQPELVEQFLLKMSLRGDEPFEVRREGVMPLREALLNYLELTQINPGILNKCQRLLNLTLWDDRQAMMDYAYGRDIIDLIDEFDWVKPLGMAFVAMLSRLAPRYYSIASAPVKSQNQVEVVYRTVVYQTHGRQKQGVATGYMMGLTPGDEVDATIMPNQNFKLPQNLEVPILMLAAGTGVAPFRGFMQARTQMAASSQNWLFYGETHAKTSFIFQSQWADWVKAGQLTLTTAFSRDQAEKIYVQDRLWAHKETVWQWIERGAVIYVCGSQAHFAQSVEAMLKKIITKVGQQNEEIFWQKLKDERRLQMDVY